MKTLSPVTLATVTLIMCNKGGGGGADYSQKQCGLGLAGTWAYIGAANTQLLQSNKFGLFAIRVYLHFTRKEAPEDIRSP